MPTIICICILLIYFKVISKKKGSLLPPLTLLYCPSAKFNLGLLIFIDVAVLLYRTCVIFLWEVEQLYFIQPFH